jgi:transketolase
MALSDYTVQNEVDTRSGFGAGILALGKENPDVVALCADLVAIAQAG